MASCFLLCVLTCVVGGAKLNPVDAAAAGVAEYGVAAAEVAPKLNPAGSAAAGAVLPNEGNPPPAGAYELEAEKAYKPPVVLDEAAVDAANEGKPAAMLEVGANAGNPPPAGAEELETEKEGNPPVVLEAAAAVDAANEGKPPFADADLFAVKEKPPAAALEEAAVVAVAVDVFPLLGPNDGKPPVALDELPANDGKPPVAAALEDAAPAALLLGANDGNPAAPDELEAADGGKPSPKSGNLANIWARASCTFETGSFRENVACGCAAPTRRWRSPLAAMLLMFRIMACDSVTARNTWSSPSWHTASHSAIARPAFATNVFSAHTSPSRLSVCARQLRTTSSSHMTSLRDTSSRITRCPTCVCRRRSLYLSSVGGSASSTRHSSFAAVRCVVRSATCEQRVSRWRFM